MDEKDKSIVQFDDEVVKSRKIGRINSPLTRSQRIAYNIFLKIAYDILIKDKSQDTFEINIKTFCNLAGIDYHNYYTHLFNDLGSEKSLKKVFTELQTKSYQIEYRDEKGEPYQIESVSLLSYFNMKKEQGIRFRFDKFIKDSILAMKNFYILKLPVIISLRSTYSIAFYEQIVQRKEFGKWQVSVEDLRGIMGIKPEEYKRFTNFKNCVIDTAVKEINDKLQIKLTYLKIVESKKIIALNFYWSPRAVNEVYKHIMRENGVHIEPEKQPEPVANQEPEQVSQEQPSEPAKEPVNDRLENLFSHVPEKYRTLGTKSVLLKYLDKDDNYIISKIEYTSEKNPDNFAAYLAEALKNDYTKDIQDIRDQEKLAKEIELQEAKRKQEQELEKAEAEQKVNTWWKQRVDQELTVMSEKDKEEIWNSIRGMASSLSQETQQNIFRNRVKAKLESQEVKLPEKIEDKKCQSFESLPPEEKQKYIEKAKEFLKKEYRESNLYEKSPVLIEQKAIDLFNQEKIA